MAVTDEQKRKIDAEIKRRGLNEFGDPQGTMYLGGTPLFNEMTGRQTERYEYIAAKHPEWLKP